MSYDSLRPLRMLTCRLATNVELPTAPSDLLHGTIASGHVVCTGKVIATISDGGSVRLEWSSADTMAGQLCTMAP